MSVPAGGSAFVSLSLWELGSACAFKIEKPFKERKPLEYALKFSAFDSLHEK